MNRPPFARIAIVCLVACSGLSAAPAGAIEAQADDPVAVAASTLAEHFDRDHFEPSEVDPEQPDVVDTPDVDIATTGAPGTADGLDLDHVHVEELTALAQLVVDRVPEADPNLLLTAWLNTTDQRRRVVLAALAQTGDPYKFATAGPDAFDCSGLSKYAWGTVGVQLFHYSKRQIDDATAIDRSQLQPGDLVWRPGHVMLYLGAEDLIVNAVQPGKPVTIKRWGKVQRFGNPIHDPIESADDPSGS